MLFEITLLGLSKNELKKDSKEKKLVYESFNEIFRFQRINFNYNIKKYAIKSNNNNIINQINFYENRNLKNYKIDNQNFYKNIEFKNQIDEFYFMSEYFIKFISTSVIKTNINKNINIKNIEICRVDKNYEKILEILGYQLDNEIIKEGHLYKYRNDSIIMIFYPDSLDNIYTIEIHCFCNENEKDIYEKKLFEIRNLLKDYFIFEDEIV
jgi:phosphopantetheine adenylyltransferase